MQHNFMPGDAVKYKEQDAEVVSRGAKRNTYFVEIRFNKSGKMKRLENNEISALKKI